jgi:DNA-3-methyladenine glycosylase I
VSTSSNIKPEQRCGWPAGNDLNVQYHDHEWGVPEHDEPKLFEMITLEGAQAGLSWLTILKKRDGYRTLFENFDIHKVAAYSPDKIDELMLDASIVRHRGKIEATVNNAQCILSLWKQGKTLDSVVWGCVDGKQVVNRRNTPGEIPAITTQSSALSKTLKKLGFRFVGETTCYAFMQAAGLVNDHVEGCDSR